MTDKELNNYIVRFMEGDESAFDMIYEETKKSVYLSIRTIIKEENTIEDLMQDTYMRAIRYLNMYKLGTNFKAWISRIAKNTTLNYLKVSNRQDIVDAGERPDVYGTTENEYFLDEATRSLDDSEKDIIVYRIILGLTFKEIGEILELPLGTIYWQYQRAIDKMKEDLK